MSKVKLAIWFPTFLLVITYVLSTPNGFCKLIIDIYVSIYFQWYKELFNPMSFDYYNCLLKIHKSTGTLTPKVGAHLGVCGFIPSHSSTLLGTQNVILEFHSWPTSLQAFALVTSTRPRVWQCNSRIKLLTTNSMRSHDNIHCENLLIYFDTQSTR